MFTFFSFFTNWSESVAYLLMLLLLYKLKRKVSIIMRATLIIYYLIAFLGMLVANYFTLMGRNNIFIYVILSFSNTIFIPYFYYNVILNPGLKKVIFLLGIIGFVVSLFLSQNFNAFSSKSYVALCILVLLLTTLYFFEKIKYVTDTPIYHNFSFWIVCNFFLYFTSNFFVFHFFEYLTKASFNFREYQVMVTYVWGIHNMILLIPTIFLLIILCGPLKNKLN